MGQYAVGITTKKKILDKAKELFYELGYNETSLPYLAQQTGVKLGTLQYHYNNKRDLYEIIYIEDANKNEALAKTLTEDKSDYIQRFAIQTAIYYYRIFYDEKYRRFAALSMELLYKNNPKFMSRKLDFIEIPTAKSESDEKENLLKNLSLIGIDYALSNYIMTNADYITYEDAVMYLIKTLANMYSWSMEKSIMAGKNAISIIKKIPEENILVSL